MPIYEYRCTQCGEVMEVIQKVDDPPRRRCGSCRGRLEKLISRSAFVLKGGGWFSEGYGAGGGGAKPKPKSSSGGSDSDGKSDTAAKSGEKSSSGSESKSAAKSGEKSSSGSESKSAAKGGTKS